MKSTNYSKTLKENIRIFLRFLKETKVYEKFLWEYKNHNCHYDINDVINFFDYIKFYKIPFREYLIDSSINFYSSKYGKNFWYRIDDLWLIYIYKNKLYGKSYTISKNYLLCELCNIVESASKIDYAYKKQTIKEIERILDSEKVNYNIYYD